MKKLLVLAGLMVSMLSCKAQYDRNYDYDDNVTERYFYDDNFDWRWDVRVRITDGINSGRITNREANRLFERLENVERKEFRFQADGNYSVFEQNDVWDDVVYLNRKIGLELNDNDRRYYGYNGFAFRGNLPCYTGGYDFNRFDRRGYGSIRFGYAPRNYYPRGHYYHRNHFDRRHDSYGRNNNRNNNRNYRNNDNRDRRRDDGNRYDRPDNRRQRTYGNNDNERNSQTYGNNSGRGGSRSSTRREEPKEEILTPRTRDNSNKSRGRSETRNEQITLPNNQNDIKSRRNGVE